MKLRDVLVLMHWIEVSNSGWQQYRRLAMREFKDVKAAVDTIDLVDAICEAHK